MYHASTFCAVSYTSSLNHCLYTCNFIGPFFLPFFGEMSSTNVVEGEEGDHAPQVQEAHEDDNNQPQDADDYEQVTNKKLYLVEALRDRKKEELAEFVFWKEVLEQVQKTEDIPFSASDVVTSKQKLVAELEGKKEKHLRRHYFYNQLMGVMLSSPDTEDTITSTLPPIYRSFFYRK